MLRIEYKKTQDRYYFLYVTDELRTSTTEPDSFNLEYKDGSTVQIHNVWTYLEATQNALFELNLLMQHSEEVLNAVKVLRACGVKDED